MSYFLVCCSPFTRKYHYLPCFWRLLWYPLSWPIPFTQHRIWSQGINSYRSLCQRSCLYRRLCRGSLFCGSFWVWTIFLWWTVGRQFWGWCIPHRHFLVLFDGSAINKHTQWLHGPHRDQLMSANMRARQEKVYSKQMLMHLLGLRVQVSSILISMTALLIIWYFLH